MDRLREMEMFVRVVEAGSFSAAARDLIMGQPAVSKTIASLEDRLGVRLLTRSTRKLSPTEAGTAFYERAIRAIGEANEAEAAAQGAGAGLEGRLRISAPVTFSRLHLVPKLGSFLDAHPKVQLDLVMDDRAVDLVAENIDVALRLGVLTDSALKARKLGQADRLVVATPAYLARRGVPRTPADLLEHDSIIYGQSSGGQEWLFRRGHFGDFGIPQSAPETECGRRSARSRSSGTGICHRFALDVCAGTRIGRSSEYFDEWTLRQWTCGSSILRAD